MEIETTGFSPAPDAIVKEFGSACGVVFGKVWRYCQMSEGVCRASIDTISNELGMSWNTVKGHMETLIYAGYIVDTTPDEKGKPHVYSHTGTFVMRLTAERRLQPPQFLRGTPSVSEDVHPQFLRGTPSVSEDKDSIKIDIKKEEEPRSSGVGLVFLKFESNVHQLTPMVAEELTDYCEEYTAAWVNDAIDIAVKAGKRNLRYIGGILRRFKSDGRTDKAPAPKSKPVPGVILPVGAPVKPLGESK